MAFLLTSYYYPLSKPIPLSNHLHFYLDNPQTDEEIESVVRHLRKLCDSGSSYFRLIAESAEDTNSIEFHLFRFRDRFVSLDESVRRFFDSYNRKDIIRFIARMLVIARYDDKGAEQVLHQKLEQIRKDDRHSFIMLPDEHPLVSNANKLKDYGYLLSLLIHTNSEDYWGQSFLLDTESGVMDNDAWFNFLIFGLISPNFSDGKLDMHYDWYWRFLPTIMDTLVVVTQNLDNAFDRGDEEKLLYIGNILKIVGSETRDTKTMLLLLTSILELILTHSPDFSRFNVEDSISKQFQLKTAVLAYLNDRSMDVNALKEKLKAIYQARSSIAHGNFGQLNQLDKSARKKGEEFIVDRYAMDLYRLNRVVLEEYLRDRTFVEFLKNA